METVEKISAGYRLTFPGGARKEFDFLVGAFGVNSSISRMFRIGYVPPPTWHTVQAEIPASNEFIVERLRNRIHIVPGRGKGIRFLAITPKDDFLTLTGSGEHVKIADLENERIRNVALASLLPQDAKVVCHCHPQVPVGVALQPIRADGDHRDAFIHLKNGINSTTPRAAAGDDRNGISSGPLGALSIALQLFRYDNVWNRLLLASMSVLRKPSFGCVPRVVNSGRRNMAQAHSLVGVCGDLLTGKSPVMPVYGRCGTCWALRGR